MASPAPSPAVSRSKSPQRLAAPKATKAKKPKTARKVSSGRPSTLSMITQAITSMKDKKGSSTQAIRKFILAKYPGIPVNFLPSMLKRAFAAGLKSGALVRPKASTANGASGRFRVGKVAAPKKKAALKKKAAPKKVAKKATKAKKTVRKQAGKPKKAKSMKKKPTTKKTAKKTTKKVAKKTKPKAPKAKSAKGKMVK